MKYGFLVGLFVFTMLGIASVGGAAQRLVLVEEWTNWG